MALQGSGQISFSQIENEFGQNGERSIGDYRTQQSVGELSNLPLDSGIPTSGEIKFSDFYSKRLNIVVDMHSGGDEFRKSAKNDKWNNNNLTVIGGFRSKKEDGSKIIIHVNKTFGSDKSSVNNCAVRTGSWNSSSTIQVDVGGEGEILGAGGDGGAQNGGNATDGGTALYIASSNVTVTNTGTIRGGGGGGRGGSNGQSYMNRFVYGASGNTVDCLGGTGGAGGNGEGYNSAATNGVGGTSKYTSWTQYGGYFASLGYGACNTSGSWTNGGSGGNGGNFGAQGGNNGGAGGKYIELASSISYTLSNSGTLTGNAP